MSEQILTVSDYFLRLAVAFHGIDPAVAQDATYDAQEFLAGERETLGIRASDPAHEAELVARLLQNFGEPREVVESYSATEIRVAAALAHRLDPSLGPALPIAACTLAWMLGFVTPGAPAGLGVREAVLLGLLGPVLGEPAALLLSLQLRLATLGGDLLLFVASGPFGAVTGGARPGESPPG